MFATRLLFLQMCGKLFLQRKSKKQSMCRPLDRYLGCWTRESLRTTSHAKDGGPSLSGLTAFFDLAWTMVRFARRPDDAPRMEIVSKDERLEYRRWPEDDQPKSLFNSSLKASLHARLAAAVVSK